MDLAELLIFAVVVAVFGIGFIFGRGNDTEGIRLRQELADKDEQLDETLSNYQADLDRLIRTTDHLQLTMHERDQRDAFIGHMRSDHAFAAWSEGASASGDPQPATEAEIRDWLERGLGLAEGEDFVVRPDLETGKSPDFVRFHLDYAWVIESRDLGGETVLKRRLQDIVENDADYLANPIMGRTNVGHMVVVTNPAATAQGILPSGYEEHESLFLTVYDFNGFAAADVAVRTLVARLSTVDTKVDPHHIEIQANEVIRQGQSQIRAGQQLVMLGEAIRQNLIGTIPFGLVDQDLYDDILFQPVDGNTTVRMKPLPRFNPMESNPSPLQLNQDAEYELEDEVQTDSTSWAAARTDVEDHGIVSFDSDAALLDKLDERERAAFDLSKSFQISAVVPGNNLDPSPEDPDRDSPPTWV